MNVFYNSQPLNLERRKACLERAKELSSHWWIDVLDCRVSVFREKIERSFEEAKSLLTGKNHFSVIFRATEKELEVAFCTMNITKEDYYVWIMVPEAQKDILLKEFNLLPVLW